MEFMVSGYSSSFISWNVPKSVIDRSVGVMALGGKCEAEIKRVGGHQREYGL